MTTSPNPDALHQRFDAITRRIHQACEVAGRAPDEVTLVAVSKKFAAPHLQALYDLGVRDFGESYAQEWEQKQAQLPSDIKWHFIGHLQSRKARVLVPGTHLIHSVDRESLLKELSKRTPESHVTRVLLQVNVSEDENKSGAHTDAFDALLERALSYDRLRLDGVMTIPAQSDSEEVTRSYFRQLKRLQVRARASLEQRELLEQHPFEVVSMGMSADFELAIQEGATHVRVGSALFGPRDDQ